MHIEFNPSRPNDGPGASQSVNRRAPVPAETDAVTFEGTRALEQKLADIPATRPAEVERARSLIADVKYPPQEMMSRIASLLAMHIKKL